MKIEVGDDLICIAQYGTFTVGEPARIESFNVYINQYYVMDLTGIKGCYFDEDLLQKHFKLDAPMQILATSATFDPSTPHTITIPKSGNYRIDNSIVVYRRVGDQLEFTSSVHEMNENKLSCTCGTHKTFGMDCDISFHSSWCELRNGGKV